MKAPKTPSPKRERKVQEDGEHKNKTKSPASPKHATERLSMPGTKKPDPVEEKSMHKRSKVTTALLLMFCAGLFFFTAESIRYALRVGGHGELNVSTGASTSDDTPTFSTTLETAPESSPITEIEAPETSKTNQHYHSSPRGKNRFTSTHRALKMGRGKRRGRRGLDYIFLNGGLAQGPGSNIQTEPAPTRVMTNIQIFQQGLGFLPAGTDLILAPAPRGRGSKRGMGRGGRRGSKGRRSRSEFRTRFPTQQPSHRPSSAPSSVPSSAPSSLPSTVPSRVPSSIPSSQPSLSDAPSSMPSGKGPTIGPTPVASAGATPGTTPATTPGTTPATTPGTTPATTPGTTPATTPAPTPPPT